MLRMRAGKEVRGESSIAGTMLAGTSQWMPRSKANLRKTGTSTNRNGSEMSGGILKSWKRAVKYHKCKEEVHQKPKVEVVQHYICEPTGELDRSLVSPQSIAESY